MFSEYTCILSVVLLAITPANATKPDVCIHGEWCLQKETFYIGEPIGIVLSLTNACNLPYVFIADRNWTGSFQFACRQAGQPPKPVVDRPSRGTAAFMGACVLKPYGNHSITFYLQNYLQCQCAGTGEISCWAQIEFESYATNPPISVVRIFEDSPKLQLIAPKDDELSKALSLYGNRVAASESSALATDEARQAAEALASLGNEHAAAQLLKGTLSTDSTVCYWIARGVLAVGDGTNSDFVAGTLTNSSSALKASLLARMTYLRSYQPRVTQIVRGYLTNDAADVRYHAIRYLQNAAVTDEVQNVAALLSDEDPIVVAMALAYMSAAGDSEHSTEAVKLLRSTDSGVRANAVRYLTSISTTNWTGQISQLLDDSSAIVRSVAEDALRKAEIGE